MKKGSTLGLVIAVIVVFMFLKGMQPTYEEVSNVREDNGLIELIFFTGEQPYLYQEDEPHAVFVEFKEKKFKLWKLKYVYDVKYVPFVDDNGKHCTWDPENNIWGESLDEVIRLDDMN